MNWRALFGSVSRSQTSSSPVPSLLVKADGLRDQRQWAEAAIAYRAVLDQSPDLAGIWVQYGHALKESGNVRGSIEAYRQALSLEPDVADTHLQLGHALKLTRRPRHAISAYLAAIRHDPNVPDALGEVARLFDPVAASLDSEANRYLAAIILADNAVKDTGPRPPVAGIRLDVSDLFHYWLNARTPSGIQRVQLEVGYHLRQLRPDTVLCTFRTDHWIEMPPALFDAMRGIGATDEDSDCRLWRDLLARCEVLQTCAPPLAFTDGDVLLNIGTGWFDQYALAVRTLKERHQVRFIPFVHDLIPFLMPETCQPELVGRYLAWLAGVWAQADHFLANSACTRSDLIRVAAQFGHNLGNSDVTVIPLDADCRPSASPGDQALDTFAALRGTELKPGGFVLFVSSVEPRKNHLLVIEVWRRMLEQWGAAATPPLVCVGSQGWMNDAVFDTLQDLPELSEHVIFLSGVSDNALACLYRHCLFTVYPSLYEGWGLPVTESLCHGKVPLLFRVSSLPEAGGVFAEYATPVSAEDMLVKTSRLITDDVYRLGLEQAIQERFAPRSWTDLAQQIADACQNTPSRLAPGPVPVPVLNLGKYYPLTRLRWFPGDLPLEVGTRPSAETARCGPLWHKLEDWGCWLLPGTATLRFAVGDPARHVDCYLALRGNGAQPVQVSVSSGGGVVSLDLPPRERRWVCVPLPGKGDSEGIQVDITTAIIPAALPAGERRRQISAGVEGLFLCPSGDAEQRRRLLDTITLGAVNEL